MASQTQTDAQVLYCQTEDLNLPGLRPSFPGKVAMEAGHSPRMLSHEPLGLGTNS